MSDHHQQCVVSALKSALQGGGPHCCPSLGFPPGPGSAYSMHNTHTHTYTPKQDPNTKIILRSLILAPALLLPTDLAEYRQAHYSITWPRIVVDAAQVMNQYQASVSGRNAG